MGRICNAGPELPYPERLVTLQASGIALWDVLQACVRDGSLDGSIHKESEIANDLPGLLDDYPTIQMIGFNGGKAWEAFRRLVSPALDPITRNRLKMIPLPSTSPANAGMPFEQKFRQWQELQPYLQ